ncbi:hypothetical protein EMIHUDRAFT_455633 [Emiliania huxleyi CCMP1516]|uniref:Cas1p 10 TM acyl transferase domain-containing protein n=2 Tax=Emiliania huxleyi TaxID=2903 RepID=A0A0D3KE88_EMIH1|nr:hypothetical protein EMIHUDRAFT_455633 [Emiliania huxleyi CCMP1516]EOD34073.1 hypothetical protein EMIHUDRAFT_455633 [Emiliania huxleyi CCMP1516]|eukprot:XP_005786502.1 hypothetical protein EMIHUDRAFT_455633 [Emiliania huxleyi CCMP1516]
MALLPHLACVAAASGALAAYRFLLIWMGSISEYTDYTAAQLGVAVAYGLAIAAWFGVEVGMFLSPRLGYGGVPSSEDAGLKGIKVASESGGEDASVLTTEDESSRDSISPPEPVVFGIRSSGLAALRAAAEFSAIMGYVYLCDRTTLFAKGPKTVSPTMFWGLCAAVLTVGLCTLRLAGKKGEVVTAPLQRDQTEEWKGWMQLQFIFYHYFAEGEIYNAIRLYIAAYVWMTGFGNFSYYYIRKDFTLPRFMQMMWRLNFFVAFVCVTMNNEYMLYYIAAMHTFFTWGVFFTCWIGYQYNDNNAVCLLKIAAATGVTHPEFTDSLHEWFFRSGLDHFVWIFGMLCAYSFPWYDRQLQAIEDMPSGKRALAKAAVIGGALAVGGWYVHTYFLRPKREYNKVHPYTSWIPIAVFLVLRNATASLRARYMHLFTWCGKVTLETYILQFHIWMKSTGINGSPKFLMVWLPSFWLNMAVVSAVYFVLSYRVFKITVVLRDVAVPKDNRGIFVNSVIMAVATAAFYAVGVALKG